MSRNRARVRLVTTGTALFLLIIPAFSGQAQPNRDATAQPPTSNSWAVWPDPLFTEPYIDIDEWRDMPVRHRYVHGGFRNTDLRFSYYFPPKDKYGGRFFQPISAFSGNENSAQQKMPRTTSAVTNENSSIGFAVASGAYLVESNHGTHISMGQSQDPTMNTVMGYRASAAAAQYSRYVASLMYGPHRPYGYAFGGSGGSKRTICGVENTIGVWDGSVPYVMSTPMSMPNVFTNGAHSYRVLKDKWPTIVDALDPGGGGDMYAGLNAEERTALQESTRFGFPPRAWFAYERLGYGPLAGLINFMTEWDPTYFDDFWTKPGYLGANPPESLMKARVQHRTTIARIILSDEATRLGLPVPPMARGSGGREVVPAALELTSMPRTAADLKGASLILKSGAAEGLTVSVSSVSGTMLSLGMPGEEAAPLIKNLRVGDQLQLDNSVYLAAQTYQRHQVPGPDYVAWDQYRDTAGKPAYPQRATLLGSRYARGSGGCIYNGWINGKMIVVETLMDEYAHPWQADWYRAQVQRALGSRLDDNFRLWYVDNAMHGAPPPGPSEARIVQYTTVLQQALRDLSAWVEKGVPPPASSIYRIVDGQVVIPATAAERKGVQPVVTLTANGGERADVKVGEPVQFSGTVEVPAGTGRIVTAEWDFAGAGNYPVLGRVMPVNPSGSKATVAITHTFTRPGTYFAALRVGSQRNPDRTAYARLENIGRARIVVR